MSDDTFRWVITGAVAVSTLCIVLTAIAAIMLYRVVAKLQMRAERIAGDVEPVIKTVRRITDDNEQNITDIVTRVADISLNAKDISEVAKEQAHRFAQLGRDFADRTQAQIARVDSAVDKTVDQVQQAGENVRAAMLKPVKEASGLIAGVKAAVSTYTSNGRRPTMDHITQDEEMFI